MTEQRPPDYTAEKNRITERMLQTVEMAVPGLRERLDVAELGTPLTNAHYCAGTGGSMYGTEKTLFNVGPFAHRVSTEFDGLWLCGDSTVAHGVVGAMLSGVVAAGAVMGRRWEEILDARGGGAVRTVPAEHPDQWPDDLRRRLPTTAGTETASQPSGSTRDPP